MERVMSWLSVIGRIATLVLLSEWIELQCIVVLIHVTRGLVLAALR